MIRKIYKKDYRGYTEAPIRKSTTEGSSLKYSRQSDRNQIRKLLKEDFHSKCAYCGWEDDCYNGGPFHIEHIKNKDKYPESVDDYQNMAFVCSICNTSKGNKEVEQYIDPVDSEFQKLFYRNKVGAIVSSQKGNARSKVIFKFSASGINAGSTSA